MTATLREELLNARNPGEIKKIERAKKLLGTLRSATVASPREQYTIANEIIKDFKHTKGLKVFGFGVGYAPLLFFLKHFMGAKVKGIDLGYFSERFTKSKRLGVKHSTSVDNPSLKSFGKFDVTYSINVFESDILDRKTAIGMLDNLAHLTRKGGKSYHLILFKEHFPFSNEEIEKRGFRIDKVWAPAAEDEAFIKLTKIRD